MTARVRAWPAATLAACAVFSVFGVGLVMQPERWARTPAYANLLTFVPAPTWGLAYFATAAALAMAIVLRHHRGFSLAAHAVAFLLLIVWESAFIVRWLTDANTTVVNVVSWGTYLALVVYSARHIDFDHNDEISLRRL